jgi:hypothetical protein
MSQELHYTSVPRGLKPGSRGFCTVGLSAHMPGLLVERLEALSGYQPVFAPHDPSSLLNPIVFSHLRLTISGKVVSVLSRIGPAGLDYSGRPSKYAHHVVLEGSERPEGGPAWLLSQPGFMHGAWEGEPREIPAGRTPPQGDRQPGVARAWQALIGDGGWAGLLAETFLADPRRTVFLVFRPGMDLLPLFVEALALLPASRRWDVDFSTYFNQLPQGMTCAWRGVLDGSDEAKNAQRLPNTIFFDLCHLLGRAEGGALVHLARTGEGLVREPGAATTSPASGRHVPRMPYEPAVAAAADPSRQTEAPRPRAIGGSYELLPELARLMPAAGTDARYAEAILSRQRRKTRWVLVTSLFAACLLSLSIAGLLVFMGFVSLKTGSGSDSTAAGKKDEDGATTELTKGKTERAVDRPQNTEKSVSEAGTQAKSERIGPVLPQQGPVVKKEQTNAPPPEVAETKPAPPPDRKRSPLVLFIGLPATPGRQSLGPETKNGKRDDDQVVSSARLDSKKHYVQFSAILNMSTGFKMPQPDEALRIETASVSAIGGTIPVATIRLLDGTSFSFRWDHGLDQSSQKDELTEAVRDFVLKVKSNEGDEDYLLLRDPKPHSSNQPFDLKNDKSRQLDHSQKRSRTFSWADQKRALIGTKWKIGIRRWRIANRLTKDGPERIMAAGDLGKGELKDAIEAPIGSGDVHLSIRISHDEKNCIQVILQFDSSSTIAHNATKNRLFRDYAIKEPKSSENSPMSPLEIHKYLKKIEADLQGNMEQFNQVTISSGDLRELRNIVSKEILYNFMDKSEISELSVVIGLRLDDGTIIDIARIGTFANPEP